VSKFGHDEEENRNDVRDVQSKSVQGKNGEECCRRAEINEVEKHDDEGDKHQRVERDSQTRVDLECQYGLASWDFDLLWRRKSRKGVPYLVRKPR
jgi:hypothetical protein